MLVTLIKKKHISTLSLPEKSHGQYWIQDRNENSERYDLLSIEARNGQWEVRSNRVAKVLVQDKPVKSITLVPGSFYELVIAGESERAVLFTEEATLDRQVFHKYVVKPNCTLEIGRVAGNDIVYKSGLVSSSHAKITYVNGKWLVEDLGSTNGTFVNDRAVRGEELIVPGDMVYIMGLKIIVGDGFIAVNYPDGKVEIGGKNLAKLKPQIADISDDDDYSPPDMEYFYRSPRFKRDVETASFRIDPPPNDQIGDEMPFALAVGPSITMGMASVVTGSFTVVNAISNGNITSAIPAAVMSVSMLLGTMLWPIVSKQYEKRRKRKREALRQEKYTAYLEEIKSEFARECTKQKEILKENSVIPQECVRRIENVERNLWERSSGQNDFLEFRLGLGSVPLRAEVTYTERRFELDYDNLREEMYRLCESTKLLENVPISLSLKENPIAGVIGHRHTVVAFVKGLILQLSALYGYDEVKCVFLYDEKEEKEFSFVKWLPHVWDNDRRIRLIATNGTELKEVSTYISREIEKRQALNEREAKDASPHYVIFALSKDLALRAEMLKQMYSSKTQLNISVVACFDELKNLPKECSTVVELDNNTGKLYDKNDISGHVTSFLPDTLVYQDMLPVATQLANISLDTSGGAYRLPQLITFLDMFGVGKVEYLNSLTRWQENDPTKSLETAVGVNTIGDTFMLDLHEKYHGPHGLIAGTTGSGKSEFIITYILSLAVNYSPNEVAFILIDYKGGGMAKSFKNLPHTAGIITNLDGAAIKRSLLSIDSELTRRQKMFSSLSDRLGISNIDIYKYQKLYRENVVSEPLQHLFIISDEFAELKNQKPEFMDQLVSAARIGRSLGVHLVLATQKPSGVVDDQIWSNTKFRVCLKVQDRADSMDMLKRPEAAELADTGRFYLQVGFNELFELGQSAWAGAPYYPKDGTQVESDESVVVVDRNGRSIKSVKINRHANQIKNPPKQVDSITNYLNQIAAEENIQIRKLWLDPIPCEIYIEEVRAKYGVLASRRYELNPLIGELDDPRNQRQCSMTLPISRDGNAVIFGSAGVGKTMFLNALIYSLITEHTPDEVNIYILDFAAETLRAFGKAPHVGDVVLGYESEKVTNLFKLLLKEIGKRKKLFADVGGDYGTYMASGRTPVPNVVVVINNYAAFKEMYGDQEENIAFLSREGTKYGIYFVLTATGTGAVGFRMLQNFKQMITMQMNDETEYSSVVGNTEGLLPARYKGRGLVKLDTVYEFQTAYLSKEMDTFTYIQRCCEVLQYDWPSERARRIPVLPEKVDVPFALDYCDTGNLLNIPVGVSASSMEVCYHRFDRKCISFVSSSDAAHNDFLNALIELMAIQTIDLAVFDVQNRMKRLDNGNVMYYANTEDCNNAVHKLVEELVYRNNSYKDVLATGGEPPKYKLKVVVINSLTSLLEILTEEEKVNLKAAFSHNRIQYNLFFVVAEGAKRMVRYTFEKWYAEQVSSRDFLWIGDGLTNQMQLIADPVTSEMRDLVQPGFGFVVRNAKAEKIKVLSSQNGEES